MFLLLEPTDPPIALEPFAARVRASSNFRFAWQWFSCWSSAKVGPAQARAILGAVIDRPACHAFLIDSAVGEPFTIERLHEHVSLVPSDGSFEQALARAAADRLGAHSRILAAATPEQAAEVASLFGALGPYQAFELTPGSVADCPTCKHHNNQLFSSWFHGVAWDWLFCVRWPASPLTWIGCLTDID